MRYPFCGGLRPSQSDTGGFIISVALKGKSKLSLDLEPLAVMNALTMWLYIVVKGWSP